MDPGALSRYLGLFGSLNRKVSREHGLAPHKPILLLAVLDEIRRGAYRQNLITITPELAAAFRAYWRALVPPAYWRERMAYPFRHLLQDGFWHLQKEGASLTAGQLGEVYSLTQLSAAVDGARLAPDLWELLQDRSALSALRAHLLQAHFHTAEREVQKEQPAALLDYEAARLKAEAQSRFRARRARESGDDTGYYVRHALFPRVIRALYDDACAVCDLAVRSDQGGGIVDAAHIMPFGDFHNDDPRNGLALCKNHHWGFDAGWFTVTDDYKLLVSPRLRNGLTYTAAGSPLRLPSDPIYTPAHTALTWHRENRFLK